MEENKIKTWSDQSGVAQFPLFTLGLFFYCTPFIWFDTTFKSRKNQSGNVFGFQSRKHILSVTCTFLSNQCGNQVIKSHQSLLLCPVCSLHKLLRIQSEEGKHAFRSWQALERIKIYLYIPLQSDLPEPHITTSFLITFQCYLSA